MILCAVLGGCQTRTQAKTATVTAAAVALLGGYLEHENGSPPYTAVSGGTIAVISGVSIGFLDEKPRAPLLDDSLAAWQPDLRNDRSELVAAIQRTGCFGTCPAYRVAIYRDGEVRYLGDGHVTTQGPATGRLAPEQIRALDRDLAAVTSLDDAYVDLDCTDMPTVHVWVRPAGGPTSYVVHYLGDTSAPRSLFGLEATIDATADVARWIGMRGRVMATACR